MQSASEISICGLQRGRLISQHIGPILLNRGHLGRHVEPSLEYTWLSMLAKLSLRLWFSLCNPSRVFHNMLLISLSNSKNCPYLVPCLVHLIKSSLDRSRLTAEWPLHAGECILFVTMLYPLILKYTSSNSSSCYCLPMYIYIVLVSNHTHKSVPRSAVTSGTTAQKIELTKSEPAVAPAPKMAALPSFSPSFFAHAPCLGCCGFAGWFGS